jgi:hypothetical protein
MATLSYIDFLAPIPSLPAVGQSGTDKNNFSKSHPLFPYLKQGAYSWAQLEPADLFTYSIMGLAALIAIAIPLLNWS